MRRHRGASIVRSDWHGLPSPASEFAAAADSIPQVPFYAPEAESFAPRVADPFPPGVRPPHTRKTFRIPRTRPWDWEYDKYLGGGPIPQRPEHGPNRHGVWDCGHYIARQGPRTWTLHLDTVLLRRDDEEPLIVLRRDADDANLFSMEEFGYDYEPGGRVTVQHHRGECRSIEASYFTIGQWKSDPRIDDADPIRLDTAGLAVVAAVEPFELAYETRLQSGEIHWRRDFQAYHDVLSFFAGARWFELSDEFRARERNAVDELVLDADNRMIGLQVGIQSRAWASFGIFRIDSTLKGGVYRNAMVQDASFGAARAAAEQNHVAWVGEAAITGVAPVAKRIFLRGGYHAIHMAGVAVARDALVRPTSLCQRPPSTKAARWSSTVSTSGPKRGGRRRQQRMQVLLIALGRRRDSRYCLGIDELVSWTAPLRRTSKPEA